MGNRGQKNTLHVALINPPIYRMDGIWLPPLALGYLAAVLLDYHHMVHIFDANVSSQRTEQDILAWVTEMRPDVVAFTTYTFDFHRVVSLSQSIKHRLPRCRIILGGYHAPPLRLQLLEHIPEFDAIVDGPGEFVLPDLIARYATGDEVTGLPGVAYRTADDVPQDGPPAEALRDLDILPFPAWHLMSPLYDYPGSTLVGRKGETLLAASVITSRGCSHRCSFCAIQHSVLLRSPESVAEEVHQLVYNYGVQAIKFIDPNFLGSIEHAYAVIDTLHRRGLNLPFQCACRADDLARNPYIVKWLQDSGCCLVEMGAENANRTRLQSLAKDITPEEVTASIRYLKEAGISYLLGFILFHPDSTVSEITENLDALRSPEKYNMPSANLLFTKLEPFPRTATYNFLEHKGLLRHSVDGTYYYDFVDPRIAFLWDSLTLFTLQVMESIDLLRNEMKFSLANYRYGKNNVHLQEQKRLLIIYNLCVEVEEVVFSYVDEILAGDDTEPWRINKIAKAKARLDAIRERWIALQASMSEATI